MTAILSEIEKLARLRLLRSENVGPVTFRQLLARFGTAVAAVEALPDLARRGGRKAALGVYSRTAAENEMTAARQLGVELFFWGEPTYPTPLAAIEGGPPILFVRGNSHLLTRPMLAIVGARNASAAGIQFARHIAQEIGDAGLNVVSGMARGIDTAAHYGALRTGTVAVLAGGADNIYPFENAGLYEKITELGVLVSEMPLGTKPIARHFPPRNRIISGLALGVLVVEAAPRSGSLITARLAGEQGREVFAVPGSPLEPRARGPNALIRQGAQLVESAIDILEALRPQMDNPLAETDLLDYIPADHKPPDDQDLALGRMQIVEKLGPTGVSVDELIRQTHLTPAVVLTILLELELAGALSRNPGNKVALQPHEP